MATLNPTAFRLSDEDFARIEALAARWGGPVKALDRTAVVREALRRCAVAEGLESEAKPARKATTARRAK